MITLSGICLLLVIVVVAAAVFNRIGWFEAVVGVVLLLVLAGVLQGHVVGS